MNVIFTVFSKLWMQFLRKICDQLVANCLYYKIRVFLVHFHDLKFLNSCLQQSPWEGTQLICFIYSNFIAFIVFA